MNYAVKTIFLKSEWFDEKNKDRKFLKIANEGLNLYINLFKFLIPRQQNPYTFFVNIAMLRKETGYTTENVLEILKSLRSHKIIKLTNVSRWDMLIENGKIKDGHGIMIEAIDYPDVVQTYYRTTSKEAEHCDNWIVVDLDMFQHYVDKGLNEKYYPIYCLMEKLSHGVEQKCYMTIENMATVLGYDKDTLNRMVIKMNRLKVVFSNKKSNNKGGHMFEHHLCKRIDDLELFAENYF